MGPGALLLGHRGARACKSIPENTLASFDRALADGCDGFEFDVRLSADGKPVICHDPQTEGLKIAEVSAQQLPGLPQLKDILCRYQDRAFLDIELKVPWLEKMTVDLLRQHPPCRGFVVSSFLPEVLQAIHSLHGGIPLGLICETRDELRQWSRLPIQYAIPHYRLVEPELIRKLKVSTKKILVWTVNAAEEMKQLAAWGVDGIISDDPKLLSTTLR
jgi:glycerophosphoryl diester phosphodiesterase